MNIKFVPREDINISKRSSSKYKPVLDGINNLDRREALEVSFENEAELNSIRNIVYTHNRENKDNIKSSKHSKKKVVYFYRGEEI